MIHCRFEHGNETDRLRHMVADIVCIADAKVLLVRRSDDLVEGGKWALPGGFMDRDETIEQCAAREFLEETGHVGDNFRLFGLETRPERGGIDDRQTIAAVFLCEPGERVQEPDHESTDMQWFDLESVERAVELAFDHRVFVDLVRQFVREPFALPLLDGHRSVAK